MNRSRPVEIVGGGLAGLSLGLALRRQEVPVTVYEAGNYPRAKVCGEFISGLDAATVRLLQLEPCLTDQRTHRNVSWHSRRGLVLRHRLPQPAVGVSRHWLDAALAAAFRAAGGDLQEGRRLAPDAPDRPGLVRAHGRRQRPGGWLGLKVHVPDFPREADLEMHLGDRAYVGLAGVENGRCNVCGLFAPRPELAGPPAEILDRYLRASGLQELAERLRPLPVWEDSRSAIAGVHFGVNLASDQPGIAIGDAFAAIPPFTGHGMAMALQGAALAVAPLAAWSRGVATWEITCTTVRRRLQRRFRVRLAVARLLHPWLLEPRRQRVVTRLHDAGLLPVRWLYHALH